MPRIVLALVLLSLSSLGCRGPEAASAPPGGEEVQAPAPTAGERAYRHLERLVALGPRPPGSPAAAEAAAYVRERLAELGLAPFELGRADGDASARVVVAELPASASGASGGDLVLLLARYDSEAFESFRFLGANDGASGAALLLVLAETLVREPLPYRTWLAFLEGDAHPRPGAESGARLEASALLLEALEQRGLVPRVRLAVYWDQVADRDLTVSRDLHSDRVQRDSFFRAAHALGLGAHFPLDADYDPVPGAHRALWEAGVRRVVALVDDRFGGDLPPGVFAHTQDDTLAACSATSLDVVARVSLAGLRESTARLRRIDAYTRRPAAPEETVGVAPEETTVRAAPEEAP